MQWKNIVRVKNLGAVQILHSLDGLKNNPNNLKYLLNMFFVKTSTQNKSPWWKYSIKLTWNKEQNKS